MWMKMLTSIVIVSSDSFAESACSPCVYSFYYFVNTGT